MAKFWGAAGDFKFGRPGALSVTVAVICFSLVVGLETLVFVLKLNPDPSPKSQNLRPKTETKLAQEKMQRRLAETKLVSTVQNSRLAWREPNRIVNDSSVNRPQVFYQKRFSLAPDACVAP